MIPVVIQPVRDGDRFVARVLDDRDGTERFPTEPAATLEEAVEDAKRQLYDHERLEAVLDLVEGA